MKNYGLLRVAAAVPVVKVADVAANKAEICSLIDQAEAEQVSVLVFPELSLTGASCGDLFGQNLLLNAVERAIAQIKMYTRGRMVTVCLGAPVRRCGRLYDCAVILRNGAVKGIVPRMQVSSAGGAALDRWFSSGVDFLRNEAAAQDSGSTRINRSVEDDIMSPGLIFRMGETGDMDKNGNLGEVGIAVEFGEELSASIPMSSYHALSGAQLILNLASSNDVMYKHLHRKQELASQSRRTHSAYIYCGAGVRESTQDVVCSGDAMIYEDGELMAASERFSRSSQLIISDVDIEKLKAVRLNEKDLSMTPDGREASVLAAHRIHVGLGLAAGTDFDAKLYREVDALPFIPKQQPSSGSSSELDTESIEYEAVALQVAGLASRLEHIGHPKVVIGVSGGLDSTLALLVCALAFDKLGWDRQGIIGVTMPGFGTSGRTYKNALDFMTELGIRQQEISIVPAVKQHFEDIGQDIDVHDVTYENSQARERTQILMDLANKEKGIVLGTGDLSELALGWATYNGDHMSMYGVNASVPKTLVRHLVMWISTHLFQQPSLTGRGVAAILKDIVDTPVSPELTPADEEGKIAQKTEDLVGPYELHDFFLYHLYHEGFEPDKIYFLAKKAFAGHYEPALIQKCLRTFYRRFFSQQFKRSCLPDGPKVTEVSLSPRGDWAMPSDARAELFMAALDQLKDE